MRFGWFEKLLLCPFLISVLFFKCLFFYASCEIKHQWTNNYTLGPYTFAFLINVKQNTFIKSYFKIRKF
ncbi:hypothetical protein HanXRQr2_Chr11g0507731 [Helianthus annuus]|uniref:Uncharacterized protein n=1 Tax=Helianthus annuus TaxID=4232 RepID=A0A9K3HSP9_HELAN|nr:hypothetical protein HanXRQr2_Chr11g0507731 [Helianthus annuus]